MKKEDFFELYKKPTNKPLRANLEPFPVLRWEFQRSGGSSNSIYFIQIVVFSSPRLDHMKHFALLALLVTMTLLPTGCKMNEIKPEENPFEGPRTPENIRQHGNHLLNEPSLYLQQHAHNPLDWYPWGEEALNRAKAEDKPIFLSIGYSSCHWCHVMEHEVFEKDDVAHFMNENFICIKVDREERPDLDSVYMEAVQMMTGRGGWPMSVFLTPDLKPFHGGTYFPHDHFMKLVTQIVEVYATRRDELEKQGHNVAERIAASSNLLTNGEFEVDDAVIQDVADRAKESFDPEYAGFQQQQKFPTPARWRFLMHEYRQSGDQELGTMIEATLEAMQGGGIYDHLGGGFHRYTVDQDWTVPHFEKMLYDNGQLAGLFLEGGVVFNRDDFTATGTDVLEFLMRDMRDNDGGFFASYDADSGGEEGTYYIWDESNITDVVGETDGPALADVFGITPKGNFEHTGKSVLTRRTNLNEVAKKRGITTDEVEQLFLRHRMALRKVRDERIPPGLDQKIVTSWNGLVVSSLAQAYAVTGEKKFLKAADKTVAYLLEHHRSEDGSLWRSSSESRTSGKGILDDYAFLADALLELYQVSGNTHYLKTARELVDFTRQEFGRDGGGFYLTAEGADAPLGRRLENFDSVIPAGNSVMLQNLIRLTAITGESIYLEEAKEQLGSQTDLLKRAGFEMAWSCDAARKIISRFYTVVIAGKPNPMFTALMSDLPSNAVCSLVPKDGADQTLAQIAPALAGKTATGGITTAYVCEFGTCKAPTTDPQVMLEQLAQ